jgi:OOP family OmpA-OmpF porin
MHKNKLITIVSLTSLGFLPFVQAADQNQDTRWYIAPFGTFVNSGGDRRSDDGWGGGIGFGKILDKHFNVELKGFYQNLSGGKYGGSDMTGGLAEVQYYIMRDTFSPYTVLGLGGMNTSHNYKSGAGFIGEAGAGFTYEVSDNFLIRSDVRYRYNQNFNANLQPGTNEFSDMVVNLGFVIPFGDKPKALGKTDASIAAIVDCSTLDEDADGVNDCLDRCPGTPKGSKVDANGCLTSIILKGVKFKYDSAELTSHAMEILDSVVVSLVSYAQKNDIEVQGHASSEGTDDYNMKLSLRRSQSVADYLKTKGVANKLTAKGYGETRPIADNSTEAGKSQNRRVELIWSEE